MIGFKRTTTLAAAVMLLSAGAAQAAPNSYTGSCALALESAATNSMVAENDNLNDGGVTTGTDYEMGFWARGIQGTTGNAHYIVEWLPSEQSTGAINFGQALDPTGAWTFISNDLGVIDKDASGNFVGAPVGTTSVIIKVVHAMGPIGPVTDCGLGHPNGLCQFPGKIYVDDVFIGESGGANVLANGGFETAGSTYPAERWIAGGGSGDYTRDCGDDGVQIPVLPPLFAMLLGGSLLGLGALKFKRKSKS